MTGINGYQLIRIKLNKNFVLHHAKIVRGHLHWLRVDNGIDDLLSLKPNGYETRKW